MKENDLLWQMRGQRKNEKITWKAEPKVIREIKDNTIWFYANGGGCSVNAVGKLYFETKEQCEQNYLKKHSSFEEDIDIDEATPIGIEALPRTNWETYEVVRFDTVNTTSVYLGGLGDLRNVTDLLKWHEDKKAESWLYQPLEYLALNEISSQLKIDSLITVIAEGPQTTTIFQYGNYLEKSWVKLGSVMGYE